MQNDPTNQFRPLLEDDPPAFLDRVNTPWDQVPDLEEYNQHAYKRVVRALKELTRSKSAEGPSNTQGILILGEAGTGKTHLLMRVARNLSKSNHILFVRKPNNEDAVAQHVWANVVSSLTRSLPESGTKCSQLDDLLAHVFSEVLIPEFEQDIQSGTNPEQRRRWVEKLRADPFNLFNMLGEGEKRQDNMEYIRRRTLRFLQSTHPYVDQQIARVLITYCFVSREDRKRVLLTWLSGQDVDEGEAKDLGLPTTWVNVDESSLEASTQQQREEQALRAIRSIGILSTYYQPLILAFDQLEGLRDQERLTTRWGDTVREIFTMTPNFLILTCIFPSLWDSWFAEELDLSVSERIAQQTVTLETFGPQHGLKMLATHLAPAFAKHRLPTSIYPFSDADVTALCSQATSPRSFLQAARSLFESWLDGETPTPEKAAPAEPVVGVVSQEAIDTLLRSTLVNYETEQRSAYNGEIPMEQDFLGRIKNITEALLKFLEEKASFGKATCGNKVMPSNLILKPPQGEDPLCIGVLYSEGNAFAARMQKQLKGIGVFAGATIMGDGKVALILDVLALAQKAHVVSGVRERALSETPSGAAEPSADRQTVLLFATQYGGRMAIPLSVVERLEEFPRTSLEKVGAQDVVQYRDKILPLIHVSRVLRRRARQLLDGSFAIRRRAKGISSARSDSIQVVVHVGTGRRVGLVVDRILDIAEETVVSRSPANRPGVLFSAVIQGRVTEFLDVEGIIRSADMDFAEPPDRISAEA